LVLAIVGFFVFLQVFMRISSYMKRGKTISGIKGELGKKIKAGSKLMVYFYSPACGACKPMTPIIEKLKKEKSNIFKIDVTQNRK
jgi:thioredoxin 1